MRKDIELDKSEKSNVCLLILLLIMLDERKRPKDLSIHLTKLLPAIECINVYKDSAVEENCSEDFSPPDGLRYAWILGCIANNKKKKTACCLTFYLHPKLVSVSGNI